MGERYKGQDPTTAAIVGSSAAVSTVASSALGGVAGALAVAGTEAIINA